MLVALAAACGGRPDGGLQARFSYAVDSEVSSGTYCPATSIRLRDRSTGQPQQWAWTYSDGRSSQEQNPIVDPPLQIGDQVTLRVRRGSLSDSVTRTVNYAIC